MKLITLLFFWSWLFLESAVSATFFTEREGRFQYCARFDSAKGGETEPHWVLSLMDEDKTMWSHRYPVSHIAGPLQIGPNGIVALLGEGFLTAVRTDGSVAWQEKAAASRFHSGTWTKEGELICAIAASGRSYVKAFSPQGKELRSHEIATFSHAGLLTLGEQLIVPSLKDIVSLDLRTFKQQWRRELQGVCMTRPEPCGPDFMAVALSPNPFTSHVSRIESNGQVKWTKSFVGETYLPVGVLEKERSAVHLTNGEIYFFDARGEIIKTLKPGVKPRFAPVDVGNGQVVFLGEGETLKAFSFADDSIETLENADDIVAIGRLVGGFWYGTQNGICTKRSIKLK